MIWTPHQRCKKDGKQTYKKMVYVSCHQEPQTKIRYHCTLLKWLKTLNACKDVDSERGTLMAGRNAK